MKTNKEIKELYKLLESKAKSGHFLGFDYFKPEKNEKSHRVVRIGVNLEKTFAKQGQKLKHSDGKGNWISKEGKRFGRRGYLIKRGQEVYLSATDLTGAKPAHKCFKLSGISNLK